MLHNSKVNPRGPHKIIGKILTLLIRNKLEKPTYYLSEIIEKKKCLLYPYTYCVENKIESLPSLSL